jgi:hemerythrin-like domain-containing protein
MNPVPVPGKPRERLSESASREYAALVRAMDALEWALASPAPTREAAWHREAQRELAKVVGLLQEHCEAAEKEGGIIAEVVRSRGRSGEVTETLREHDRLLREAVTLLAALDEHAGGSALSHHEVRRRAWELTAGMRRHQAREADLLIELLERDEGVID